MVLGTPDVTFDDLIKNAIDAGRLPPFFTPSPVPSPFLGYGSELDAAVASLTSGGPTSGVALSVIGPSGSGVSSFLLALAARVFSQGKGTSGT